jgi:hypothetical protein
VQFGVLGFRLLAAASIAKFNKPLEEATFAQLAAYSRRGYTPEVPPNSEFRGRPWI